MRRSEIIGSFAALAAGLMLLPARPAHAQPRLYASRPLIAPGQEVPLEEGANTLDLVLDPGGAASTTGTLCSTGDGDDVCGFYVELQVMGDITGFSESSYNSLVSGPISKHFAVDPETGRPTLKVAMVTTSAPIGPGATQIATLEINRGPDGGYIQLAKLQTVDASLDLVPGTTDTIAVPEPGFALGLGAGVAALALLARRRARRGGVR